MIRFDHLTHTYPNGKRPALLDANLSIEEGEFVLVAGASGAGKSTLLRCINGLVPHFTGGTISGTAKVAGCDPLEQGPQVLSKFVGFVFQDPEAQFVVDRVEAEIAFALENAAMPPDEMRVRVEEALDLLDLAPLRNRSLDEISGGERQRVAIAAALAFRPKILVLDEPTSQLDPQSAEDVLKALVRLNEDMGLTVVLSEHRLERVLRFCDRLVYLAGDGQVEFDGYPQDVLPQVPLTPPLITVGKALNWNPLPLTIKDGKRFARKEKIIGRARPKALPIPASKEPALQVVNLYVAYNDHPALEGVSMAVEPGESAVLMGRNGSGKSTLFNAVVGLLRPERGYIEIASEPVIGKETAELCRRVGYLPQNPDALLYADSVREELEITLRNHNLVPENAPTKLEELIETLGLSDVIDAYPRDLSVGQRQRVALGAVMVTRPSLLLLDEPTRGLDYEAKRKLVALLRRWKDEGIAILLSTHDVELAAQVADRVLILSQGEIIAEGDPATVLGTSPLFAPQISRLFPASGWLTAEDVLERRTVAG